MKSFTGCPPVTSGNVLILNKWQIERRRACIAKKLARTEIKVWWLRNPFSNDRSELIKHKLWTDVRKFRKKSGKLVSLMASSEEQPRFSRISFAERNVVLWLLAFFNSFVLYLHFPVRILIQKVLHRSAKQTTWTNFQFRSAGVVHFGFRGQMLWNGRLYTSETLSRTF